jgi:hypothetical protein
MWRLMIIVGLSVALGTPPFGWPLGATVALAQRASPAGTAAAATKMVAFSKGLGEVAVPAAYEVSYNAEGGLQLIEKQAHNVRVYADFHAVPLKNGPPDVGRMIVRAQAKEKGLKVEELADRVVMVDPSPNTQMEGKTVLNVHRVIGFGQSIVVLSTAVHEDQIQSPQAKIFFAQHLDQMILSLRAGSGKKS